MIVHCSTVVDLISVSIFINEFQIFCVIVIAYVNIDFFPCTFGTVTITGNCILCTVACTIQTVHRRKGIASCIFDRIQIGLMITAKIGHVKLHELTAVGNIVCQIDDRGVRCPPATPSCIFCKVILGMCFSPFFPVRFGIDSIVQIPPAFGFCCGDRGAARRIRTRICIIRLQHQITLLHRLHRSVPVAGNRNIHFLAGFHRIMIGQRHRKHRIGIAAGTGDLIHLLIIGAFFCIQCHASSGICTQNAIRIPLHLVPVPVPALGQLGL